MSDTTTDERGARTLDDLEADLRVERDTNVLLSDANAKLLHYVEELKLQERQCLQKQTDAELRRQHSELAHYKLHTLWQTREASLLEEMAQRGVELARLNNRLRVLAHIEQLATHNGGQLPGGVQQLYNSMRCGVCGKASPHLFQARPDCPHVVCAQCWLGGGRCVLCPQPASTRLCKICRAHNSDTLVDPCGHVFCARCVCQLSSCPLCRLAIARRLKILW